MYVFLLGLEIFKSRGAIDDLESHYHGDMRMYQTPLQMSIFCKKTMGITEPVHLKLKGIQVT